MLAAPPRTCFYFGALLCPGPQVTFECGLTAPCKGHIEWFDSFFFVTACVSTVRYLCVSMQTAFILAPQRFSRSSLNLPPSYPPLLRRTVQQPGRRLLSTLLSPAPVAKARRLRPYQPAKIPGRGDPLRRGTRKIPVDSTANAALKWGQRERLDTTTRPLC